MTMPTHAVLTARIPFGGFGRNLSETEVRRVRKAGVHNVSTKCIVVQHMAADYLGILYRPYENGYSNSGIRLELV